MGKSGHTGTSMGGSEMSPRRRKSQAARRRAQERRWAAKSGPVTVRKITDEGEKNED